MDELQNLAAKVDQIHQAVTGNKWGWVKDAFVPVATIVIAGVGIWANDQANKRQLRSQTATHEQQSASAEAAHKQKYLEYFLDNFSAQSPDKQAAAFALLKYMEPNVRSDLVFGLSANISLSPDAWRVIVGLKDVQLNFVAASQYKVEVYYVQQREEAAKEIQAQLMDAGFTGDVVLREIIDAFWDEYGWPDGNEIRYNEGPDDKAVQYLYRFVDAKNPEFKFKKEPVNDPTRPGSVAVHLPLDPRS